MHSITQTELQEEIQRHRRLQDRQDIAPQMKYVGTQNFKPGPSHKPSIHEQALEQRYAQQQREADSHITSGVDPLKATAMEIDLIDWSKIEHLTVLKGGANESVFLI